MSKEDEAAGPDLAAGVAATAIAEGGLLAGHVGQAAVLITRLKASSMPLAPNAATMADRLQKD